MFCKYCGAELEGDALFCPKCGKRTDAQGAWQGQRQWQEIQPPSSGGTAQDDKEGVNPFCIAGCILTGLSFFFNHYGIIALSAFFVSVIGYCKAKKRRQEGAMLAVVSMVISGVIFATFFISFIQYSRYEYVAYGLINRFLRWLEDIL